MAAALRSPWAVPAASRRRVDGSCSSLAMIALVNASTVSSSPVSSPLSRRVYRSISPELGHQRGRLPSGGLEPEVFELLLDDGEHPLDLAGSQGQPTVGPVPKIVEIEHDDAGHGPSGGLDGAGYSDVDDEHGAVVTGGPDEIAGGDDAVTGCGARQHDVGRGQHGVELVESVGATTDRVGQRQPTLGRAVGDRDVSHTGAMQGGGDADPHVAGPDHQHLATGEVAEAIGDHLDRGVADRGGATSDGGFGPGPLADPQGVTEQPVETRSDRTFVPTQLPCAADLPEDFALAEHRRLQPGRHLEEVSRRGVVVLAVEIRVQLVGRQLTGVAQEFADLGVGRVESLGDGVDLGAVTGAEHRDLAEVVTPGQPGQRLGQVVRGDGDPLQERQRPRAVIDTDDDDGHTDSEAYALAP